jgi:hypothetical protein
MKKKIILKENTTPRCNKSFLSENHTMIGREDHFQLEMLEDSLLVDGLYL